MRVGAENQRIHRTSQNTRQRTPMLVPLTSSSSEVNSDEPSVALPETAGGADSRAYILRRRGEHQQQQQQLRMQQSSLSQATLGGLPYHPSMQKHR
ncbi:hypothetical protein LPJ59_000309, partial [Coemansia sp. RSA 2399]